MPPTQAADKQPTFYADDSQTLSSFAAQVMDSHPELITARILYFWRTKATKKAGKAQLGASKLVSEAENFLMRLVANRPDWEDYNFKVEIAADEWNNLDERQRRALMDHRLECCTGEEAEDGSMKWSLRDPDVHEFAGILNRHGTWMPELASFCQVACDLGADHADSIHTVPATVTASDE